MADVESEVVGEAILNSFQTVTLGEENDGFFIYSAKDKNAPEDMMRRAFKSNADWVLAALQAFKVHEKWTYARDRGEWGKQKVYK
jgi:hypothetical protein